MGSFAYTCAVSGLPIEAGDRVRYLLLTKNPYHSGAENTCYIHDLWFPRTFPLKAEYNDYGSIENYTQGPEQDVWLKGLKRDMVERGWGENTCHDVPTSKEMNFDDLLNAVQEGRVLVERETSNYKLDKIDALIKHTADKLLGNKEEVKELSPEEKRDRSVPQGVPTMYRIRKLAELLNIPIYNGKWGNSSIIIDEPHSKEVRVRCHCMYGEKLGANDKFAPGAAINEQVAVLGKLQANLNEYATMMSTSSSGCAVSIDGDRGRTYIQADTELLIRPKPGTRDAEIYKSDKKQPLPVGHCMIREDVWQALLKGTIETYDRDYKTIHVGIDAFYDGVKQYVTKLNKIKKEDRYWRMTTREESHKLCGAWMLGEDTIPFTVGLSTHFDMMVEACEASAVEIPEEFLKTVAEFSFINSVLSNTRYQWRISSSAGPQFGAWEAHETLFKSFAEVAHIHAEEEKAKRANW